MNKNQNWRRVLSLLFAMVMLVSIMVVGAIVAFADEAETEPTVVSSGTWGGIDWTLDSEGTLTIAPTKNTITLVKPYSGNGELYAVGEWPAAVNSTVTAVTGWPYDRAAVKHLVIEEGVTSIGSFAAQSMTNLTGEVVIPSTVKYIGQEAFQNSPMTKITFARGGTEDLCIAPGALKKIAATEIVFPADRPVHLHAWILNDCPNLEHVVMPDTVVFGGQSHLEYANMDKVYSSDSQVLARCYALENIDFGSEAVKDRFYAAQYNASNITAINNHRTNNGLEPIVEAVKDLTEATIGETKYATLGLASKAAVDGDTITLLVSANENVTLSTNVTLVVADGAEYTGTVALKDGATLTTSENVNVVSAVANYVVVNENGVYRLVKGGTWGGVDWKLYEDGTLVIAPTKGEPVPDKNAPTIRTYEVGQWREAVIYNSKGTGVDIGGTPYNHNDVKHLIIEEGVTYIGSFACQFPNLTGEVVIPSTVTYIGQECFKKSPIEKLTFAEGGTEPLCIAEQALQKMQIESIVFPERTKDLHVWVLGSNTKLKSVHFPSTLEVIIGANHIDYLGNPNAHVNNGWKTYSDLLNGCTALETISFASEEVRDLYYKHNGTSTVGGDAVASIGLTYYRSFAAAIAAAEEGDTVTLLRNITLSESVNITKDVTIVGARSINRAASYTDVLFNIEDGATLTLDSAIVIDGDTQNVSSWLCSGYELVQNSDGTFSTAIEDPTAGKVVLIDGNYFATWADAAEYLKVTAAINITLLADVTDINSEITFSGNLGGVKSSEVNFDLNGFNFYLKKITLKSGMKFVLVDSSEDKTGSFTLVSTLIGEARNVFTIADGVEFEATLQMNNTKTQPGTLVLGDVEFVGVNGVFSVDQDYTAYLHVGIAYPEMSINIGVGTLNLNRDYTIADGHKFTVGAQGRLNIPEGVTLTIDAGATVALATNKNGTGIITGEGAVAVSTFEHLAFFVEKTGMKNIVLADEITAEGYVLDNAEINYVGAANLLNSGVVITAGTFDVDVKSLCAEGYATEKQNGAWVVVPGVVKIGDVYYASLSAAAAAVQSGETITLITDIALNSAVTFGHDKAVVVTLDLNGYTLTAKDVAITSFRSGTVLTVTNGTINGNSSNGTLRATYNGKLVLGDNLTVLSGGRADAIVLDSGKLDVTVGATIRVQGGINCLETNGTSTNTINITGGTFVGNLVINANSTCVITGGAFTVNVTLYCAEGYCAELVDDTWYVVDKHNYVGDETAPTVKEDGYTTYTCTRCGDSYVEVAEGTRLPLDFKGTRLLLKDGIGIYFMVDATTLRLDESYVAVITYAGTRYEVPFAEWTDFNDGVNLGILFDGIEAKDLGKDVSVVLTVDGVEVSVTRTTNVKAYAQAIIDGNYADDAKELANALLNYGALAENAILGANNDVNADVNSKFEDLDVEMSAGSVTTEDYYGSSVNLNNYLGFNFKFFANAVEGATHAVITYNGKTVVVDASVFTTETKKGNELVVIELEQLLASDAAAKLTCTVYNGEEVLATATDSVYNYCARALAGLAKMDGTAYAAQKYKSEFYKALVLYIEAANKYTEKIGYDAE